MAEWGLPSASHTLSDKTKGGASPLFLPEFLSTIQQRIGL